MTINPDAVGSSVGPEVRTWTSKDSLLYALGVGAGAADPTGAELSFTTENTAGVDQQALPTMAVVLGAGGNLLGELGDPNYNLLLHAAQDVHLHQPLPAAATANVTSTIAEIWDKGKAALVITETTATDANNNDEPLFTTRSSLFFRGEGGWGGESGPKNTVEIPDRDPDTAVTLNTRTDQALLYRLNGDRNPLHSDPAFAERAGFPKPILHGLCTYGFTGRGLLEGACGGDPDQFGSMTGRFTSPVMPGEDLTVRMWIDGDTALFQTAAGDGRIVIDKGVFTRR